MLLELRRDHKEDYIKVRRGLNYRTVNRIMCSLEHSLVYFKSLLSYPHRNNKQGLLKAKVKIY